jgi:hypothetical protein
MMFYDMRTRVWGGVTPREEDMWEDLVENIHGAFYLCALLAIGGRGIFATLYVKWGGYK